jgi:urease accessory protein
VILHTVPEHWPRFIEPGKQNIGCTVWETDALPPRWPLLLDAPDKLDLAIVPVHAGGGTRIKLLEAFAHGVPVVSTRAGAFGTAAEDRIHLLLADSPEAFADACAELLCDARLRARFGEREGARRGEIRSRARRAGHPLRSSRSRLGRAPPADDFSPFSGGLAQFECGRRFLLGWITLHAMNDVARAVALAADSLGWDANLSLRYERRGPRTVLERRAHRGPLVVQKSLYPEGEEVCQNIVVHPPAGIVGGDYLTLEVAVGENARAQLATPGAAKWYRSAGAAARQSLRFTVAAGGVLEWLPQETIVFDGAIGQLDSRIALASDAVFLGWEIVCLGRRLAGEAFARGRLAQDIVARRDGRRQWIEQTRLRGGSALLASRIGLAQGTVFGTFLALAPLVPDVVIADCRTIECHAGEVAVTLVPGVLIVRYRGDSGEAARDYFAACWKRVRPALTGRDAVPPRIWNT